MSESKIGYYLSHPAPGEEVLVTGLAGYFPDCDSVAELQEKLFNKVDLISDDDRRWSHLYMEAPHRTGKIKNVENFDASFFGIDYKDAHYFEPMSRLLLERSYEAIIDAGVNPAELRNTRTGVFTGAYYFESDATLRSTKLNVNENGVIGCLPSLLSSRISEWLGVTGPAYNADSACSSATFAIEQAFKAIRTGECDAALVCGAHLCLLPEASEDFSRFGITSVDGRCKAFDKNADGYVRSEAAAVCFLQKAKDSRRAYAQLLYAKTNCDGFKDDGITHPSGDMQRRLIKGCYEECSVEPYNVEFLEAHGTGTAAGDPEELKSFDLFFSSKRKGPLLLGSLKSNLGHTEAASGVPALAKLCIAYHSGYIPPNLNFKHPQEKFERYINDGKLKIVTDKQPWNRGMAAFSGFGIGGANAHIVVKNWAKEKVNNGLPTDDLPRLVCVSGRTHSAVQRILNALESKPMEAEEIRLWHAIHEHNVDGHHFRGYVILESTSTGCVGLSRSIRSYSQKPRPVCLVYSDLEPQSKVVEDLMKIHTFAAAIEKCHDVLLKKGLDLKKILLDAKLTSMDNMRFSLTVSTAIKIALTDVLRIIGLEPNYYFGFGEGKICCAYAEGLLNMEEAISVAHYYEVNRMDNKGLLLSYLKKKIPKPKMLSSKSLLFSQECQKRQATLTAESFLHVLMNSIKPEEAALNIPDNAITIEVGHTDVMESQKNHNGNGFLIKNEIHIALVKNMCDSSLHEMLQSFGRLYEEGVNLKLANIYPAVSFPVSQGTPMLSHLVEWDHRGDWFYMISKNFKPKLLSFEHTITISLEDPNYEYLKGHVIGGRIILPGTGYLELAWRTLGLMMGQEYLEIPVVFENLRFHRATTIPNKGELHFNISIQPVTGEFELSEKNTTVVTGIIYAKKNIGDSFADLASKCKCKDPTSISQKDYYKEIRIRGYEHGGIFKGFLSTDVNCYHSIVSWPTSTFWDVFLDYVLQCTIIAFDTRKLYVPARIEKFAIDPELHYKCLKTSAGIKSTIDVYYDKCADILRCGGVEVRGLNTVFVPQKANTNIPVYETYNFVPNINESPMTLEDAVRLSIEVILENTHELKLKVTEFAEKDGSINSTPLLVEFGEILRDIPYVRTELTLVTENSIEEPSYITVTKTIPKEKSSMLVIGTNLMQKNKAQEYLKHYLREEGFILSQEHASPDLQHFYNKFDIITSYKTINQSYEYMFLLRKKQKVDNKVFINVTNEDQSFSWIDEGKKKIREGKKVVFYGQDELCGVLGLVNCLRKEQGGKLVNGLLVTDPKAPPFDPHVEFYKEQLSKDLAINVFQDGQWGTYRHLIIKEHDLVEPVEKAFVNVGTVGDLSTLKWVEGYFYGDVERDATLIPVHVHCASLNFRDVVVASGRVPVDAVSRTRLRQQYIQGIELAGKTSDGKRVMTIVDSQGISTTAYCQHDLLMCIPDEWSMEEAVTIPVTYSTVYLAFDILGKLKRGESVLIHAGTGGIGQAAINVALHYGCEIFTTVGSLEKKDLIKKLFPQLKDSHIASTRDTYFEEIVYRETNGKGVDLVLNSLADDKLLASIRCLGYRGRFLELGKYDIFKNTTIDMSFHDKEISFHGVMFDYIAEYRYLQKKLIAYVLKGISEGAVRPLTYCTFEKDEVESANRFMAAGKHIGKVVIKIRDEPKNRKEKPTPMLVDAHRRFLCFKDYVYVVVGGLGGFGLELADWLVLRGAKKLLIVSSKGISTGYQAYRINFWKSYVCEIQISTDDITTHDGCTNMLLQANSMGRVDAIFNLAAVLRDALFQQQTSDTFKTSFGPKAVATNILDQISRKLCPELRHFVVFSSLSCGRGNTGQSNYGMANSVMERICEKRRREGFPGLAIQWGPVGDVGLIADMQIEDRNVEMSGIIPQRIQSCLDTLDRFLTLGVTVASTYVVAERKVRENQKKVAVDTVAEIMGIKNLKSISYQTKLAELGMDSMMALEIKQTLERDFEIILTPDELRSLTFAKLVILSGDRQESEAKPTPQEIAKSDTVTDIFHIITTILGDEEKAYTPFVFMPTKLSKPEFQETKLLSERMLFLLPGIEGFSHVFENLCRDLDISACVLQYSLYNDIDDLNNLVDKMYQILKPLLQPGKPFEILGYSFGMLLVLDLVARLESEGYTGRVFSIEGSPTWAKAQSDKWESFKGNSDFNNSIMNKGGHISFVEQVNDIIKAKASDLKYSNEYNRNAIIGFCNRINIIREFKLGDIKKIKSPIVLLRAQNSLPFQHENYNLEDFTSNTVDVYTLKGDHVSILQNKECASIINKYLTS